MFYSIQKNLKKFLSILLIFTFILGEFYPVNAAIFPNDEQAAKNLPYIYAYDNSSLCDVHSSREITDNSLLKKSIYYSFGALGYCNQYSVFEEFYLQHQALSEEDKLQLSSQIVTDIYKAGQPLLDAQGNFIRSNVSFQTTQQESNLYNANAAGNIDLIYNFDSSNLQGINGVWQTYLCLGNNTELLVVNDEQEVDLAASKVLNFQISENEVFYIEDTSLDNIEESVSFMGIDTDAFTSSYHLNLDKTSKNTVVTDTVYLSNLIEGNEYKLISTLVDGQTGEIITDKNGKPSTG